jgi:hypothetical protein
MENNYPNFQGMNEKIYFLVARMYNRYVDLLERLHDGREKPNDKERYLHYHTYFKKLQLTNDEITALLLDGADRIKF